VEIDVNQLSVTLAFVTLRGHTYVDARVFGMVLGSRFWHTCRARNPAINTH